MKKTKQEDSVIHRLSFQLAVLSALAAFALRCPAVLAAAISVMDFGAVGDGAHNDTAAIQSALDSGAANVAIPAGTYSIDQTLLIGSGTTLQADPNAVIRLANGANTLLINNRPNAANITVQGGIWDGNNEFNQRGADSDPNGYSGSAINFVGVSNLVVSDLTVRNPDAFSIRLGNVQGFRVENIKLDFTVLRLNQDGVHVAGNSRNGVIRGISAITPNTPNDDMVALNADDSTTSVLARGLENGPISNVLIENVHADNAYTFVRLYGNTSTLEDVTIRGLSGGFRYHAINMSNHAFPVGAGDIRNVRIEDCDVTKTADDLTWAPAIDIGLKVENLYFSNFIRNDSLDASTLVLRNQLDNTLLFGDGTETQTQSYTISQGGIDNLWINRTTTASEPSSVALLSAGLLGWRCRHWFRRMGICNAVCNLRRCVRGGAGAGNIAGSGGNQGANQGASAGQSNIAGVGDIFLPYIPR